MTTTTYALTHFERGWLMLSMAFLMSGIIYALLILRLTWTLASTDALAGLQLVPVILLFSLSLGFLLVTAGHYALRISLKQPPEEEKW